MSATQTIAQIKSQLAPVFDAYGVRSATLFGSMAKGLNTTNSDVDLLVDSGLTGLRFVGLMEAIRRTLLLPVDLLDVSHIEKGSRIEREILATGVKIYEK